MRFGSGQNCVKPVRKVADDILNRLTGVKLSGNLDSPSAHSVDAKLKGYTIAKSACVPNQSYVPVAQIGGHFIRYPGRAQRISRVHQRDELTFREVVQM
jgi:hypothetical protein